MDPGVALQILVLIVLLLLSAFFSSAETALIGVNRISIRTLAEEGNKRAELVLKLTEDPSKVLSAILIGNNVVNLSASSLATVMATRFAQNIGATMNVATIIGIATGILTILVLIFGEITPKSIATQKAEKMSLRYVVFIDWLTRLLTPIIFIINLLTGFVLRLLGHDPHVKTHVMTEDEFLTVLDVSHEDGVLETEEREMITNVVDFGDAVASDVMVPRIDICFIDVDTDYEEVLRIFREEKYARIPVFEEDKDHIIGILNLKDVFCFEGSPKDFKIKELLRKPYFTYEFQKVSDLMMDMQKKSLNMSIVLDEYGDVAGLITMEDLLEEIVGEIRDEYDEEEKDDIRKISDHEYMVNGNTRLEDIGELLNLELESDDYDSIAGHMLHELGHIPTAGESVQISNIRFTVQKMDRHRIETIHIQIIN